MNGKRLIEKIRLRNILSFGDKGEEITLEPLNIIIGQNASGKSNLVDVIKLFRSLPQEKGLIKFVSRNGGISEWLWKGKSRIDSAVVEITLKGLRGNIIVYELEFGDSLFQRLEIYNEKLKDTKNEKPLINDSFDDSFFAVTPSQFVSRSFISTYNRTKGIFLTIDVFADLQTNRNAELRKPQVPDAPNDFLAEDGSNLALVLNDLEHRGDTKDKIIENLKKFNLRIKDYSIRILGGTVQLFIREEGLEKPISAMRLSDGTLRYLCLLAILCHPEPPPLICIEEPETGLHPDILPTIAELMIEASQRTQLIVTTHSDILVSAFSEVPEAVLVCEKDEDGTHFKRLEKDKLKAWLKEYELGDLWLRGEIGGKRW